MLTLKCIEADCDWLRPGSFSDGEETVVFSRTTMCYAWVSEETAVFSRTTVCYAWVSEESHRYGH